MKVNLNDKQAMMDYAKDMQKQLKEGMSQWKPDASAVTKDTPKIDATKPEPTLRERLEDSLLVSVARGEKLSAADRIDYNKIDAKTRKKAELANAQRELLKFQMEMAPSKKAATSIMKNAKNNAEMMGKQDEDLGKFMTAGISRVEGQFKHILLKGGNDNYLSNMFFNSFDIRK